MLHGYLNLNIQSYVYKYFSDELNFIEPIIF